MSKNPNCDISDLDEVLCVLNRGENLDDIYHDHPLKGNYKGRRECHVRNDWLLIYKKEDNTIIYERTGTHADLFAD